MLKIKVLIIEKITQLAKNMTLKIFYLFYHIFYNSLVTFNIKKTTINTMIYIFYLNKKISLASLN